MITLQELCDHLNKTLKSAEFDDYCPNGLQVEGKKEIKKIGTAVSATYETIAAAIQTGCDALVVHHGLFWKGDPQPIIGSKREKIQLALESGLSLLAYHLPLDAHPTLGNNWKAAAELSLKKCKPFCEIGVMGEISPTSAKKWIERVEKYYDHSAFTALGGPKVIRQVALLSGGGYKYLQQAAKAGADCFITGNFDEPAWSVAFEEGIHFLALGHSATERVGPRELATYLPRKLKVKTEFLDIFNPF